MSTELTVDVAAVVKHKVRGYVVQTTFRHAIVDAGSELPAAGFPDVFASLNSNCTSTSAPSPTARLANLTGSLTPTQPNRSHAGTDCSTTYRTRSGRRTGFGRTACRSCAARLTR